MAEVSGLSYASMLNTARNYLRPETLHAANDAISNATASLPAFRLFDIRDEIHSSSDGQRFETQIDTFNARYSPKYFGLDKGVSANTLVANHVPANANVIGTHEHESHFVFDLLYNNTSDIQPDRHSTDTHGANQVNFFTLFTFGHQFAPRYRDLHKKTGSLVARHPPGHYNETWLIRPSRKSDDELIIREWHNVQRIMASLAQKDVTQATVVRKLSNYARQNQTKKALWELDNLCRTLYILEFIDDVGLRQSVQKALNRGEAYHRLRRAVAYVNGGKFRVQTEAEQQIWNECSRLIANAIIHYNTALLSRVYEQKHAAGDHTAMALIAGMSPVAWQHINLFGSFEFTPGGASLDIDALAAYYADPAWWSRIARSDQAHPDT
ncbi:Tn3 family transposase ISShfr9 [Paraburkholderia aspalathi]|nr:Tn3 family transposase ISShfr9 [Paraburkholderia aspalathi]